jgi:histone-lysine N-methyltransferase SETMAR
MEKVEFCTIIKFLTKQGKTPQTILEEMAVVYRNSCPKKTMIYKWNSLFKQGRDSLEDDPRPGSPVDAIMLENVEKLLLEDTRLKKKQLEEMVGISSTTILNILHQHLGLSKVSARWVPRMLTPLKK